MGSSQLSFAINDPFLSEAVSRSICEQRPFINGYDNCIAITHRGKIAVGVLFDNYYGASIQIHVLVNDPRGVTRDHMWMVFDYAFNALGVNKVIAPVASNNAKSLIFIKKTGFVHEHTIENAVQDGDLMLFSMIREQCEWLSHKPTTIERKVH